MSNKTQLQTNNTALDGYIARINAAKNVAASLPEAGSGGGSSGGIEYEIVTIPEGATQASYSLPRVTNAYGSLTSWTYINSDADRYDCILGIDDGDVNYVCDFFVEPMKNIGSIEIGSGAIYYNQGTITWGDGFIGADIKLLLINDPNKDALWTCTPST